jgi:DNA-binding transcriptional MerR regulator
VVENSSNTAQSEAPSDNWFPDDKLDRKQCADFLSSYLTKRYALASSKDKPDTLVLNIRADWGFGKTFFLTRWAKDQQINYPVVYFDAWANDFTDDPLVAFIAEIDKQLGDYFSHIDAVKTNVDGMIAKGKRLIKPVSFAIASVVAQKIAGCSIEQIKALIDDENDESDNESEGQDENKGNNEKINKEISALAALALKEHLSKKQAITVFKKRIERLVNSIKQEAAGKQLPIFIFVDELDRCRPTYAIELLEAIKHLFGVPGIYFVVATNLEQLGHSIKAVYGEQFDSERYLKRFFDQEYLLPEPDHKLFIKHLFDKYLINSIGITMYCVTTAECCPDNTPEQEVFGALAQSFKLSLRDQEQIMLSLHAIFLSWPKNERVHLVYLLFLVCAKHVSAVSFNKLCSPQCTDQRFSSELQKIQFQSVNIKHIQVGEYGRGVMVESNLISIVSCYSELEKLKIDELFSMNLNVDRLRNVIVSNLKFDCPNTYNKSQLTPLSTYPSRIRSIGQLSLAQK